MRENLTIFGIDLGTTYSCIAYVDDAGRAVVVPNQEGELTTPSVIYFESATNRVVGKEAKNVAVSSPNDVVEMVKRYMGNSPWRFPHDGIEFTPEELSSYILRKVVVDAEALLDQPITDVVITCPAYFDDSQRKSTQSAGEFAKLNVKAILEEPIAAAIAYGFQEVQDQTVLIYDLGGGTFDVTMIEIKRGELNMVAIGGDHELGGRNWDEQVVEYVADQWMSETGISDDPRQSPDAHQDLLSRAENAKKSLSSVTSTKINLAHAGRNQPITLTREIFDNLTSNLLEKTIQMTNEMLEIARKKGYSKFDHILLVGGSTIMPQVKERLSYEYPGVSFVAIDPNQAVAKGAAIYGQKLAIGEQVKISIAEQMNIPVEQVPGVTVPKDIQQQARTNVARQTGLTLGVIDQFEDIEIKVISAHSYGVVAYNEAGQKIIANLIQAQTTLPITTTQQFGTRTANARSVEIPIRQNEEMLAEIEDATKGQEVGNAIIEDLPAGLPARSPINVTFELNTQGMLHVLGVEISSGKKVEASIQTNAGATKEELKEADKRSELITVR